MTTANCPSCGAAIEFAIGSSEVVVCRYCNSVVARTDRGVESHGKVAALIDTGSPLAVGANGRYRGTGFRITGRTQMRHQAGGVWDEWYAALDDGRWGWLAEAQGRFYVTFKTGATAPPLEALELGRPVLENLVVAEIGRAELASAEGELPWRPTPGGSYDYADLTGQGRRFGTIDYGDATPVVFLGEETTLAELGVSGGAARTTRVSAAALNCSQCGGALELRAPDQSERVWCPYCGSGHDITNGKLQFFAKLKKKSHVEPIIPLGTSGTVDGDAYVVAGFMERAVHFDRDYFWTEYLLFNREQGFRWLVHSDDHWSFVTPLRPGDVTDSEPLGTPMHVHYGGRQYRLFQDATARVTHVVGEFYWKVAVGEQADTVDYVKPPFGISKEITKSGAREIAYSHARYMTPGEVEETFGVEGLNRPRTAGPMQPYPGPSLGAPYALLLLLLIAVTIALAIAKPGRTVASQAFNLLETPPVAEGPENARIVFTEPFELTGQHNLAVLAHAPVDNSWLSVSGDLVNEATGALYSFEAPLEYYHGVDQGESWSEGRKQKRVYLSRPDPGRYTMRLETQWEPGKPPPMLNVSVREGVFRWPYFLLALLAISIFPFIALVKKLSFESERWRDSAHSPFAELQNLTEEDDEEE